MSYTDEQYAEMAVQANEQGKILQIVEDSLKLIDPPPPTHNELARQVRSERDRRIAATDYLMAPDYPLDAAAKTLCMAYRKALRDLPQAEGFPWQGGGPTDVACPWPDVPD